MRADLRRQWLPCSKARYHESRKPVRPAAFDHLDGTGGGGLFLLRDTGVDVAFVVDVLALGFRPKSSTRFECAVSPQPGEALGQATR